MEEKRVRLTPSARLLKITGTRFPAVLGLEPFKTPFETWCEIERLVKGDFVETPRLKAGRIVEKKLIASLKEKFPDLHLKAPDECPECADNPYDYFPNWPIFGGKWDCLGDNTMVELKTTAEKNVKYWLNGVPNQHILQTALYAYLADCDRFIIACSFIPEEAYARPECFSPVLSKYIGQSNSVYYEYKMCDAFPDFARKQLEQAKIFWSNHVVTGISPEYTEKDVASGLVEALAKRQAHSKKQSPHHRPGFSYEAAWKAS